MCGKDPQAVHITTASSVLPETQRTFLDIHHNHPVVTVEEATTPISGVTDVAVSTVLAMRAVGVVETKASFIITGSSSDVAVTVTLTGLALPCRGISVGPHSTV